MPNNKDLKQALGAVLERKHCTEVHIAMSAEEAGAVHVILALYSKVFGVDIDATGVEGRIKYVPPAG